MNKAVMLTDDEWVVVLEIMGRSLEFPPLSVFDNQSPDVKARAENEHTRDTAIFEKIKAVLSAQQGYPGFPI